jgi:hypothetical protein
MSVLGKPSITAQRLRDEGNDSDKDEDGKIRSRRWVDVSLSCGSRTCAQHSTAGHSIYHSSTAVLRLKPVAYFRIYIPSVIRVSSDLFPYWIGFLANCYAAPKSTTS